MFRCRPLLRRVPWVGSPTSSLLLRHSDSLSSITLHFVSFVPRYRQHPRAETTGASQVPGKSPCMHAPLSLTPVESVHQVSGWASRLSVHRYCLPPYPQRRLPQINAFRGSITRPACSLSTLRGHGYPLLLYDHARLASGRRPTFSGQASTCRTSSQGFSGAWFYITFSLPRLRLTHGQSHQNMHEIERLVRRAASW